MPEQAAIFADGRYTLQVRQQVDGSHWQYVPVPEVKMADWLADHAGKGTRIGYATWLHTRQWVEEATQALAESGATLVAVESKIGRAHVRIPVTNSNFGCRLLLGKKEPTHQNETVK